MIVECKKKERKMASTNFGCTWTCLRQRWVFGLTATNICTCVRYTIKTVAAPMRYYQVSLEKVSGSKILVIQRKDLRKPSNLKAVLRDLRNHLAGMTTGITRDEALAQEIINLLFCKIYDEQYMDPDDIVAFRAGVGEPHKDIQERIKMLFERVKDAAFGDVFDPTTRSNSTLTA